MNKNLLIWIAAALIVGGLLGYWLGVGRYSNPSRQFGSTTVNYSNSLGSTNLYNSLASLLTDITNTRASVNAVVATTTAALTWPSVSTSSVGYANATTTTVTGVAVGDFIVIAPSTSTAYISYTADVNAANTLNIVAHNGSSSPITPSVTTFAVVDLGKAAFGQPAALQTVTSTSN